MECRYNKECPVLKTLEEASKKECDARAGSMNFNISTSESLKFIKGEYCLGREFSGIETKPADFANCPAYNIFKQLSKDYANQFKPDF